MLSFIERVEKAYQLHRNSVDAQGYRNVILVYLCLANEHNWIFENECQEKKRLVNSESNFSQNINIKIGQLEEKYESLSKDHSLDMLNVIGVISNNPEVYSDLFKIILEDEFSEEEYFWNIFSQVTSFFSSKIKRSSRHKNCFFLSHLAKSIIGKVNSVYDPACSEGELLLPFSDNENVRIYAQETDGFELSIARLRFLFEKNVHLEGRSALHGPGIKYKVDAIICHPPANMPHDISESNSDDLSYIKHGVPPKSNANMLWLQLAIESMNDNGIAVIQLHNESLYTEGKEKNIRKSIVANGHVQAVITMPCYKLGTMESSIWVITKKANPKRNILMVDLKDIITKKNRFEEVIPISDYKGIIDTYKAFQDGSTSSFLSKYQSRQVSIDEIAVNGFRLEPKRYLPVKDLEGIDMDKTVELSSIIKIAPRPLKILQKDTIKKVSIKNLADSADNYKIDLGTMEKVPNEKRLPVYHIEDATRQSKLLLIAKIGDKLKPSIIKYSVFDGCFGLSNVYAFEYDKSLVSEAYLIQELNKNYVSSQAETFRKGVAMQMITSKDFMKIRIVLPTKLRQQEELVRREKEIRFQSLARLHGYETEIKRIQDQTKADLSSHKHNIRQPLSDAAILLDNLIELVEENNGVVDLSKEFSYDKGKTVADNLEGIKHSLSLSLEYVENITEEIDYGQGESIHSTEFLADFFKRKAIPRNVRVENNISEATSSFTEDGEETDILPKIIVSSTGLEQILHNIFDNACNHGFIEDNQPYIFKYKVDIIVDEGQHFVEILFMNNGKPFPKGMGRKERYITKGERAGLTANTGEGGARIFDIINHFGGKLEIIDKPGSEFPVVIRVLFQLDI